MTDLRNVSSARGFLSLDNVCYFPSYAEGREYYDDDRPTFCAELPINSTEFYNAGMLDIRASVSLVIDAESDEPEADKLRYNGKVFAIYRRYPRGDGLLQLYLNEKAGVS